MRTSVLLAGLLAAATAPAQSVLPPFSSQYQAIDLGHMPSVFNYGGLAFPPSDPNTLLVSAYQSGTVRAVALVRDAQGHITGFGGSTVFATVGGNDGGLAFGPGNVLFFTWYGQNRLGQILPGSTTANRLIDLSPLGITGSVGTCVFVPNGRSGAGRCKIVSYSGSRWYDVALAPAGDGTFTIQSATHTATIQGGPEGVLYPEASSPLLPNHVLVAEWNNGLFAYETDANGDPLPATRQPFVTGLSGNAGGAIDPISGDFLFSGNGGVLTAIRATPTCGSMTSYGMASPGFVTPTLTGSGCARLGQSVSLRVDGPANGFGVLALGDWQIQVDLGGFVLLTTLDVVLTSALDAAGQFTVVWDIPVDPSLGDRHFFLQAACVDAGSAFGLSGSTGLDLWVR